MTDRVIKGGTHLAAQIRSFGERSILSPPDPLGDCRHRIAALEEQLSQRDRLIADFATQEGAAFKAGWARGKEDGAQEAHDREADRVDILELAARQAIAIYEKGFRELEALSAALARDCLQIMFDDIDHLDAIVTQLLSKQVGRLSKDSVLSIQVAEVDFSTEERLDDLRSRLGEMGVRIFRRQDLQAGACLVKLQVGELGVGLEDQWPILRSVLERLANGEEE